MVIRQSEFSDADKLDDYLQRLEKKGLPLFESTLLQDNLDNRRRSLTSYSRFKTQLQVVFLRYTLGYSLDSIQAECKKTIEYLDYHLDSRVSDLDAGFDQYILIVWALASSYLFDVSISQDLINKTPFVGRDMLVDRLVSCFDPTHMPTSNLFFPKVYSPLQKALGEYDNQTRNCLIDDFLSGYLTGLRDYEAFWSNSHKEQDPRYYRHFGYWVFELGALVADIDWWDDSGFRDHPLYPKDLVDWKRARHST